MKLLPKVKKYLSDQSLLVQVLDGNPALPPEFQNLLQHHTYKRGVYLQDQSNVLKDIIKVQDGSLRVLESREGWEKVHGFITPGDVYFDYYTKESGASAGIRIQAMETTRVTALNYGKTAALSAHSALAREFLVQLATASLLETIEHRRLLSGIEARIKISVIRSSSPHWITKFTQRDISSYLGMAVESYNRVYHQLI